jgi:hypothetical protein
MSESLLLPSAAKSWGGMDKRSLEKDRHRPPPSREQSAGQVYVNLWELLQKSGAQTEPHTNKIQLSGVSLGICSGSNTDGIKIILGAGPGSFPIC